MEEWKDIEGYEGLYQVSNLGNVKSLGNNKSRKEKLLKPGKNKSNYLTVVLCKNGEHKTCKVHRLVANAFIPKIDGKTHVDHIDGNPSNNVYTNLRWCSQAENNNFDLYRRHMSEAKKGEKSYLYGKHRTEETKRKIAKANSKQVLCIEMNKIYGSTMEVERELGIDHSNISMCCNGKYKFAGKHPVTREKLHWKYIDE